MANPFTVQPAQYGQGLAGLGQSLAQAGQIKQQRDKEAQLMQAQEEQKAELEQVFAQAEEALVNKDYDTINAISIRYPQVSERVLGALGADNERKQKNIVETGFKVLSNPENYDQIIDNNPIFAEQMGGADLAKKTYADNPEKTLEQARQLLAWTGGDKWKQFREYEESKGATGSGGDVAAVEEFKYLTAGLPVDDVVKSKKISLGLLPRATGSASQTIAELGNVDKVSSTEEQISAGKEAGKLSAQYRLKPRVELAVKTASNAAAALADTAETDKSNQSAFNVYDTAMSGLVESLGNTDTGPFIGRIPAVTGDQQIADGAIAAMAPVLKQLFRASGEGTFTDNDQKLLMQMVPTRKDLPDARAAKMQNIDAIVRAKLGITGQQESAPKEPATSQMSDEELVKQLGL